ncbi:outer membrane beta-barrel protein [Lutibacter flavus]|uniref:Outer membrane protein beta-barrel domain-containing protein n=1 Tax=Lutibacter flavus TaxID=691689 RepID=A0A238XAW4_9FLAO|nr:hypothetical protein [Lutibacter flavus]SNR55019.1 hypothetical protein SAMN04488111_1669 [Lutibacter flavus]
MRKHLLLIVAICSINLSFSQIYFSSSIGQTIGSAEVKFGEIVTPSQSENSYGSYGEGTNFQLRAGYFFNETFGVDFGIAYLHGADQTITKVSLSNQEINAIARARAFGLSPSLVYKFSNKIYGRFGALIKAGGKTEAVVYNKTSFSDSEASAQGLPSGSYSVTEYTEDYHGVLPLGFVGAFGYKLDFNKNFGLFIEAEYLGISVKRKDSEISEFNTNIMLPDGTVAVSSLYSLENLPTGYVIKSDYVDELPHNNTDPSKKLAQRVPYSSFGINFGITCTFEQKVSK